MEIRFLNPFRKLADEVVGWLCGDGVTPGLARRTPEGAVSLEHVMVVVPTAQSGRSLRLALARRFSGTGILPPRIVQPMQLVQPSDSTLREAAPMEVAAAFLKFLEMRPRREAGADGQAVLKEWGELFRAESLADFKSHLSFLDQLNDLWRILAGGGWLMREVHDHPAAAQVLANALGNECERWRQLGEFETAFFEYLHGLGLRHQAESVHLAKRAAKAVPPEIEIVVLPALVDPVGVLFNVLEQQRDSLSVYLLVQADERDRAKFDACGRPLVSAWTGAAAPTLRGVEHGDVIRAATDAELARKLARDFPKASDDLAMPTLGLCDESLYPELAAAFLNLGYELHNPERHLLSASSLGRMIDNLVTLHQEHAAGYPWEPFAALMREDDILNVLRRTLPSDPARGRPSALSILKGLDVCQNTFLPQILPRNCVFDETRVQRFDQTSFEDFKLAAKAFCDLLGACAAEGKSPAGFVRAALERIFRRRPVGASEGEQEFTAAAEAVRDILNVLDGETVAGLGLSEGIRFGLFRKALAQATYSLEPDAKTAVLTEGWLELAWSTADKIALAGFHEGSVPDSVMGHAFLPDSLRTALGLTSNDQRLARDTYLLKSLVEARFRTPGAIRAYVSLSNAKGDMRRPSRLLFLVPPEELAARTERLFGELPPSEPLPGRTVMAAWTLHLPETVELPGKSERRPEGCLSASAIDAWLKCPLSYLLGNALGMRKVEKKTELAANDFGTFVHRALEEYAHAQLARTREGLDQLMDVRDIETEIHRVVRSLRATYGSAQSVNLKLQLDAAEGRLAAFARIQAMWAQEGWRVAEVPEYGFEAHPFAGETGCDVLIRGSVDRIDFNPDVGYRLIDYKTWDSRAGAEGRILAGGEAQLQHAARLGLPTFADGKKIRRLLTVQLPLYGRCLEGVSNAFTGRIRDYCYVLLGRTAEDTVVLGSAFAQGQFEAVRRGKTAIADFSETALETARTAIRRIRAGIFWPPGPSETWKMNYRALLTFSPERDLRGTPWLARQEQLLAEFAEGRGQ